MNIKKVLTNIINLLNRSPHFSITDPDSLTSVSLWGNSTNKIALRAIHSSGNSEPNVTYTLYAKDARLQLYNNTADSSVWNIYTYKVVEYTFSGVSFTAGTIGTRGAQSSKDISSVINDGYQAIATIITSVSSSATFLPVTFIENSQNKLYANFYRCTTSAASDLYMKVRVVYSKTSVSA